MDVRDAVALSLLPDRRSGVSRARLATAVRAAHRRGRDRTDLLLRTLARALPDPSGAVRRAAELRTEADAALEAAGKAGIWPVCWGNEHYPPLLASIVDPPIVLWVEGTPATLALPAVAIVGSRAATPYAIEVAGRLAADLAERGVVVVSGLARGVDSAAHRGALRTGRTMAVLGSGVDVVYPAEHRRLAQEIGCRGAVISELPPGTPPRPHHFPLRNRLISGLSLAVVVVEASERSGSLITASCALDQGRDVMAVPGNVLNGRNTGAHALLRDGAKIVETADDILEEFPSLGPMTECRVSGESSVANRTQISGILACFSPGEPCAVEELASRTGLESGLLLARLVELEIGGAVRRIGAGRFVRS
jgi:DNA processing protein